MPDDIYTPVVKPGTGHRIKTVTHHKPTKGTVAVNAPPGVDFAESADAIVDELEREGILLANPGESSQGNNAKLESLD